MSLLLSSEGLLGISEVTRHSLVVEWGGPETAGDRSVCPVQTRSLTGVSEGGGVGEGDRCFQRGS